MCVLDVLCETRPIILAVMAAYFTFVSLVVTCTVRSVLSGKKSDNAGLRQEGKM